MPITFPPQLEQFIERELAFGHFASRDDLVVAAIRLLMQRQADVARMKSETLGVEQEHAPTGQPMFTYFAGASEKAKNEVKRSQDQFPPGVRETWRRSPFETGQRYRVIAEAPGWNDSLNVGEVITYERSSYSHYDELSIFIFRGKSGEERTWVLRDDDPLELWQKYFE